MYQLTERGGVIRLSDNAFIPEDLGNVDWRAYSEWLQSGNTPILPPTTPVEIVEERIRAERTVRLNASDWVVVRSQETGDPIPVEWLVYRQALRDITNQPGFPLEVVWPEAPA